MSSIKDFELAQRIHVATHQLKTRIEELEAERDALRINLRQWAVSSHTNKCYICNWAWSDGAPQIHDASCPCNFPDALAQERTK